MDRWIGTGIVGFAVLFSFVIVPAEVAAPRFAVGGGLGGLAASPLFFPHLMSACLTFLGACLFYRGHSRARNLADGEGFHFVPDEFARVAGTFAILVVYSVLLEWVGYILLTPVTLVALCAYLGYRNWVVVLPTAIAFTGIIYGIFRYGMKILLPEGLLD
jgi:O-antigen ligase